MFHQDPGPVWIKAYNKDSKEIRAQLAEDNSKHILFKEYSIPIHRGVIKDKSINTLIREINAQNFEEEYLKRKIPEYWKWIDLEARNTFHEGIEAGILKYVIGYNHYRSRNEKINGRLVGNKCPRYNQIETWEHVILCKGIKEMKVKYLKTLEEKIYKVKHTEYIQE